MRSARQKCRGPFFRFDFERIADPARRARVANPQSKPKRRSGFYTVVQTLNWVFYAWVGRALGTRLSARQLSPALAFFAIPLDKVRYALMRIQHEKLTKNRHEAGIGKCEKFEINQPRVL